MSQMVRESKPEVPWHRLSVEIGTGEVVFLTELIVVYLENSSCWSKVIASLISHPLSPGVLFGLIPLDITRESTSSLGSSLCIRYSSLKQPYPYLLTIIIFLSSFSGNNDRISLWNCCGRISSWKAL